MTEAKRIAIVGAGGFAAEVAWLIREINDNGPRYRMVGYLVSDPRYLHTPTLCAPILGDFGWLRRHWRELDGLVLGVGTPAARKALALALEADYPDLEWPSLVHPSFRADRSTLAIGHGAIVCAGVTATVHVRIEEFAFVNLHCTIGHGACIGRYSGVNPSANISGGARVGEAALIGTGAQLLGGVEVGDAATVGAGAVATRAVAAGSTVVGVPAKPLQRG